jgi:hypothetical protein
MQMAPSNTKIYKLVLSALIFLVIINVTSAANFNSGKTRKKSSAKTTLSFNLHNKSVIFSLSNGFHFKGSSNLFKNQKNGTAINLQSIYFQKGNNIYVVPVKQKAVILNKFKTPVKSFQ